MKGHAPGPAGAGTVIDAHTHIFPDAVAPQAVANLERHSGIKLATDATLKGLKRSMAAAGIARAVTLPVSTRPDQTPGINRFAIALRDPAIAPFGGIYPGLPGLRDEIRRLTDGGIRGVKMHPDYQDFFVDDERVFPTYAAIAEAGLILYLHAGKNVNLPDPAHCTPARLAVVLDRFPALKIIAAHLGAWKMWDEVERHLVGRPLWLDTSFTLGWLPLEQFLRIVRRHGSGRILFGTDSPWIDQQQALAELARTPLTAKEKEAILFRNAAELFGLKI